MKDKVLCKCFHMVYDILLRSLAGNSQFNNKKMIITVIRQSILLAKMIQVTLKIKNM